MLYKRNCPKCEVELNYKSYVAHWNANKKNCVCKSCSKLGENNGMFGKTGDENPFYGKHHTEETKENLRTERLGKSIHTEESKQKISDYQKENAPMRGKSVYSVWIEKYGIEEADKRLEILKQKHSINSAGSNNPMFGKPSPNGSGNGYSGWFNGIFFRSLRELMFLIYAKRFNMVLENLEQKKYGILYKDHNEQLRTYFSDYLVNGKYFVEIKPKRLWNTPNNKAKFNVASSFCEDNNLVFKLIDPPINSKLIDQEYENGNIKFTDRYLKKYLDYTKPSTK
jgi:hypothetical protein